jgi:hypothetical protein
MKDKPTIKEIIKANLKYAISVLCSIFAMAISFVWKWRVNTFIDIFGFVLISLVLVIAIFFSDK